MRTADYVRLILLAMIWGGSFLFMRIASPAFGAMNTAFLRAFFGCAGLIVILILMKQTWQFKGKFKQTLSLGIINSGIPFLMYSLASQWLPVGYSAVLNATAPLMGALIGFLFYAESISLQKWAGIIVGIIGILCMTTQSNVTHSYHLIVGIIACLIATTCYGFTGYLTKRWITQGGGLDPKLVAFGSQIGATLFLFPFALSTASSSPSPDWANHYAWISIIAVGLLCTALAYILFFKLIEDIGPIKTLTVTFLIPPFGITWGYLILGETITVNLVIGSIIICIAIWLITHSIHQQKK